MLLAMVLIAQTAALPADQHEAAITCGAAVRGKEAAVPFEDGIVGMYFSMLATGEGQASTPYRDRLIQNTQRIFEVSKTLDGAVQLIAQCRHRFPLAWQKAALPLPTDNYERAAMCTMLSGGYLGLTRASGEAAEEQRVAPRVAYYSGLVSDADYGAHGVHSAADVAVESGRLFGESTRYGNVRAIFEACEAAYPA